jgi:putative membrane protein
VTRESPDLGYERTRLASERTLMAWVRTAVSLIGFGFSIPKVLAALEQQKALQGAHLGVSPRHLGMLLIGLGTLGLAGGVAEHVQLMRRVGPSARPRDTLSVAFITAVIVGALGLLAFASVLSV